MTELFSFTPLSRFPSPANTMPNSIGYLRVSCFIIRCIGLQIATGHVGGGDGKEAVDDDSDTELLAVTGDLAYDSLEVAVGDDDGLALLELMLVVGADDVVGLLVAADNLERLHLTVGDNEWLLCSFVAETGIAVVEAEMGEVDIVENVGLEDFFGALGKEDVGQA